MPIENFCVVRPVLDKNDKPCYNGERIKLADGTFQVVNPKETSMDDVVNGEGEEVIEAIEEDGDDEVTVENASCKFIIPRCVLRAARHFGGDPKDESRWWHGCIRIRRSGEDTLLVDSTDGFILFMSDEIGGTSGGFPDNGILIRVGDVAQHLKSAKVDQDDWFHIADGKLWCTVKGKDTEFDVLDAANSNGRNFPDTSSIVDGTLEEVEMTREMAQQEKCLIPELRFHEIMLGVGVMLNVLNGMKEFHCHKKNDNETMLFSFAEKENHLLFEPRITMT